MAHSKDDPPVYLTYEGPDPPSRRSGAGIPCSKFGEILKAEMGRLSIPCDFKVGPDAIDAQVACFVRQLKK